MYNEHYYMFQLVWQGDCIALEPAQSNTQEAPPSCTLFRGLSRWQAMYFSSLMAGAPWTVPGVVQPGLPLHWGFLLDVW